MADAVPLAFNNDLLITPAGEIDHDFIAFSARARAISASEPTADPREVKIWVEKLTAMADMLRTRWQRDAGARTRQHAAVYALVGHCEGLLHSADLPEPARQLLRARIEQTVSAFGMPSHSEAA